MALRIGVQYEQAAPGLFIYDDETGLVILSDDVENAELLARIAGCRIDLDDKEAR